MEHPLVSIISIHFNVEQETIEFIESCEQLSYPNLEVIIVDNGSNKPFKPNLKYDQIKLIRSEENLGFAGGNNLGLKGSKGEYIFFLNNDTLLPVDFVEPIVSFLKEHPKAGALSPKVLYSDRKTIQYAGSGSISNYTGRGQRVGKMQIDQGQFDYSCETELGHGSSFIVPRKVINDVGPMPEVYFLYYEEHDWCEQIKAKGYKIYYLGTSHIIHKESMTTGKESVLKTYYMARNRILYLRRNSQGLEYTLGILFLTLISVPKNTLIYLLKGKIDLCKAYIKGVLWHLGRLKLIENIK
ncbi:MAG: glycosyltransferase family 2 protein [Bacteroidota bacterium]